MRARNDEIRNELVMMCKKFVTGETLTNLSGSTQIAMNTLRSRKSMLDKLDIQLKVLVIKGRGFRTPFYTLEEPLETAIKKIEAKFAVPVHEKSADKKSYDRDDSIRAGRHRGYGIESWLFIESDRAKAYLHWCDDWAVAGQKYEDIYGAE